MEVSKPLEFEGFEIWIVFPFLIQLPITALGSAVLNFAMIGFARFRIYALRIGMVFQQIFFSKSFAFICILEKANHFFPKSFSDAPM